MAEEKKEINLDTLFNFIDDLLPGLGFEDMEKIAEENTSWAKDMAHQFKTQFNLSDANEQVIFEALKEAFTKGANSAAEILDSKVKQVESELDELDK